MQDAIAKYEFEPKEEDIKIIREWVKKMPHLYQDFDDNFMKGFIRGCKGSLQRTKVVYENFNLLGYKYPSIYGCLDPLQPKLLECLKIMRFFPVPKKLSDGTIVIIFSVSPDYKGDPSVFNIVELYRYWHMMVYVALWENDYGPGQIMTVFDLKHVKLAHLKDYTPVVVKAVLDSVQNSVPTRVKGVYHINAPPYMEWIFSTFKSFAKEKIVQRYYFHSTMEGFWDAFPDKKVLPKEFGGDEDTIDALHERWYQKTLKYRDDFLAIDKMTKNLQSRNLSKNDDQEMFGTFRKLNFD